MNKRQNNKLVRSGRQSGAKARNYNTLKRIADIPQYSPEVIINNTFRFLFQGSSAYSVTLQSLLGSLGAAGATSNSVFFMADTVKINSVEIWSPAVAGSEILFTWAPSASIFARQKNYADLTESSSYPAHLRLRPPPGELLADWMTATSSSSNVNLFTVSAPTGSIIELNVSYQMYTGIFSATSQSTSASTNTVTPGALYYGYLDGWGSAGGLKPVSIRSAV